MGTRHSDYRTVRCVNLNRRLGGPSADVDAVLSASVLKRLLLSYSPTLLF